MKWSNNMSKYEFKGTRGSWQTCHRNADEIHTTFACVIIGKMVHDIGDMKDAESRANAQAISAVPELIEALREAHDLIGEKHYTEGATNAGIAAMEKIHAALNKATGAKI